MASGRPSGIELDSEMIDQLFLQLGRSYQEIADLCGDKLTRQAVYKWRNKGKIPVQHISRLLGFLKADVTKNEDQKRIQLVSKLEDILANEFIDSEMADRSSIDLDSNKTMKSEIGFLTDQELVAELERRGWNVTLQFRPTK